MVFCNKVALFFKDVCPKSHNPYFNRWFSAIKTWKKPFWIITSHNPYFNRWFSAIGQEDNIYYHPIESQSLF